MRKSQSLKRLINFILLLERQHQWNPRSKVLQQTLAPCFHNINRDRHYPPPRECFATKFRYSVFTNCVWSLDSTTQSKNCIRTGRDKAVLLFACSCTKYSRIKSDESSASAKLKPERLEHNHIICLSSSGYFHCKRMTSSNVMLNQILILHQCA